MHFWALGEADPTDSDFVSMFFNVTSIATPTGFQPKLYSEDLPNASILEKDQNGSCENPIFIPTRPFILYLNLKANPPPQNLRHVDNNLTSSISPDRNKRPNFPLQKATSLRC